MIDHEKISVIMPVFLPYYPGAATAREYKFIRAVWSFVENDYHNKELIICSDGCDESEGIYERQKANWPNVHFHKILKQPMFSGSVRQTALDRSNGANIAYLDSDDEIGSKHLSSVMLGFKKSNHELLYWDDYIKHGEKYSKRKTMLQFSHIGTSCIAHKRVFRKGFTPSWTGMDGYGHDWLFIQSLTENTQRQGKILKCEYKVCHAPHLRVDN